MFTHKRTHILLAGCFVFGLLLPTPARASLTALITTDTSSLTFGSSGFIDLQFNGLAGSDFATATIFDFSTDGSLGGCGGGCVTGDVTGDLGSSVVIQNGVAPSTLSGLNEFNEPITFGTFTQFYVTLSGPALNTPSGTPLTGSTFTLAFYAADNTTPLLSADVSGASATLTVNPDGSVTSLNYADGLSNFDTTTGITPEPSSFLLLLGGAASLVAFRRRRV